jgi:peptide/nickel transport system ATP-binding protein
MNDTTVLKIKALQKFFPIKRSLVELFSSKGQKYIPAVDEVSFTVRGGETLGFVGESGCGKTTLGRTILRLIEPTSGGIYFRGTDVTSLRKKELLSIRRKMQMIFQDPHGTLNPRRTVSDIIRQTIRIHQLADTKSGEDKLISKALEEVGLTPVDEFWDRYPQLLSGGQRQRVGIARVLVLEPELVIADEPVSMLDVSVRIGILELILRLKEVHGISLIFITHDLSTARYVCDRIAIMYLGKIVEVAPTEVVLKNPSHPYTKALISAVPVPVPTKHLQDIPIRGYVPLNPEDFRGCRFNPRCLYPSKECRAREPRLIEVGDQHFVACHEPYVQDQIDTEI